MQAQVYMTQQATLSPGGDPASDGRVYKRAADAKRAGGGNVKPLDQGSAPLYSTFAVLRLEGFAAVDAISFVG